MSDLNEMTSPHSTLSTEVEGDGLRPLREHRAFIIVFVLSAMLSALALTYIYSERYRAETVVLFKSSDVVRLGNRQVTAFGSPTPTTQFKTVTQTANAMVGSDLILRRVVEDLHLDVTEPRDLSGPWYIHYYKLIKFVLEDYANDAWQLLKWGRLIDLSPMNEAVAQLRKQLKLRNDDSYLYTVQATAKKPQLAAAIADDVAVVLSDILRHDEEKSVRQEIDRYAALRDEKVREVEGLEIAIRDLLANNQIASTKDELEKTTDRAARLLQSRADTMADLRKSDAVAVGAAEKLRVLTLPVEEVEASPRRRFSRISPEDYGKIATKRLDSEIESGGLRAKLAAIDQSYTALVPRIQKLGEVQAEYDLLTAKLSNAKGDHKTVSDALEEALIRASNTQIELRVQAPAAIPEGPVSPIKIYHVPSAGALAALIAIGIAYVFDFFKIRLFLPPAGGRRRRLRPVPPLGAAAEPTPAE